MGRTLHYHVFGKLEHGPVPEPTRRRILDVQQQMNHDFTWTCENLGLDLFEHCQLTYAAEPPRPWAALLGRGFTKVRDDEWNAALVVRFLRWASSQLPEGAFIRLHDEGDYVVPEDVLIAHGRFSVDAVSFVKRCAFLREHAPEHLRRQVERATAAKRGEWLLRVPALGYSDRREMKATAAMVTPEEFATLTLEDVADRLAFPWMTELRSAA